MAGPYDVLIDHVVAIADALDGSTEAASANTGDRLRGALKRIADYFDDNPISGGASLPTVSAPDNGSVLQVVNGAWAKGSVNGLPAVNATNNGKILKVVDGVWALADDATTSG